MTYNEANTQAVLTLRALDNGVYPLKRHLDLAVNGFADSLLQSFSTAIFALRTSSQWTKRQKEKSVPTLFKRVEDAFQGLHFDQSEDVPTMKEILTSASATDPIQWMSGLEGLLDKVPIGGSVITVLHGHEGLSSKIMGGLKRFPAPGGGSQYCA